MPQARPRKQIFDRKTINQIATTLHKAANEVEAIAKDMQSAKVRSLEIDGATLPERSAEQMRRFVGNAREVLCQLGVSAN
jgi:uncharacterized membrane protein